MKTVLIGLVSLISFFAITIISFAGIGETLDQCEKVYGKGEELSKDVWHTNKNGKSFRFKYNNMDVYIYFDGEGKAFEIFYRKLHKVLPPSSEQDKEGVAAYINDVIATGITPAECASLLKLNRNCEWTIKLKREHVCEYVTNDGSNLAAYYWKLVPLVPPRKLNPDGLMIGTLGVVRDTIVRNTKVNTPTNQAAAKTKNR